MARRPTPAHHRYETDLQVDIIEILAMCRWLCCHVPAGGADPAHRRRMARAGYKAGWPDLICVSPQGRTVYIECKLPGKHPTPEQEAMMAELRARGAEVILARSIDDIKPLLDR